MLFDWLRSLFRRKRLDRPEQLVDEVIVDLRRRITESRIQVFASELAMKRAQAGGKACAELDSSALQTQEALRKLESTLEELQTKRDLLVARTRDAQAKAVIETTLMDLDRTPADVALELLEDSASDSEAAARAAEEVREITDQVRGGMDV